MCKMFEVVTGRKSKGSVDKLEGLTKMYTDLGEEIAIIKIPVELMEIDTRYQTEERTQRDLDYLVKNWDERKLMTLIGVPHWEEGKVYIVDGYGRWIASQIVDKVKYKDLKVQLILNAPTDPQERLGFEAELYAFQNRDVKMLTAIQKHGSMMILHDPATMKLEKLKEKYGFEYVASKGNRDASVLGSYTDTLALCKIDDGVCAEYVFDICVGAGFDRKPNGYSRYVMRALKDIYKLYAHSRYTTKKYLIEQLRKTTPLFLKANAVSKYPLLESATAVSLYIEDMVVEDLGLEQCREAVGNKTILISKKSA